MKDYNIHAFGRMAEKCYGEDLIDVAFRPCRPERLSDLEGVGPKVKPIQMLSYGDFDSPTNNNRPQLGWAKPQLPQASPNMILFRTTLCVGQPGVPRLLRDGHGGNTRVTKCFLGLFLKGVLVVAGHALVSISHTHHANYPLAEDSH